jgi:hypothetical protein
MHPSPSRRIVADPWREASSRALHPSATHGTESLLTSIATGLAAVAVPWELVTTSPPIERCYQLLLSTEQYDAWLIHWPVGTGLAAHDHGGSAGSFAVVDGVLDEDVVTAAGTRIRRVAAGHSVEFGEDHVHAVANRGTVAATSVHVYSPPLRTMGFYEASPDGPPTLVHVEEQ